MTTKVYRDDEADLKILEGKTIAIIGYGNQGRAQALNMRDSGLTVVIGGIEDDTTEQAKQDGFEVYTIPIAAQKGDIICLLVPDEIQKELYTTSILPALTTHKALYFSHGYAIHYGLIVPSQDIDVILVAPRMIGALVRDLFVAGGGAPACIGVQQDASNQAWGKAIALAKAIGATKAGAFHSSFAEETELDHFSEQVVWPAFFRVFIEAFDLLVKEGYAPEIVALELWASGEAGEVMQKMASMGLFRQMTLHSHTSQYGTLSRTGTFLPDDIKARMKKSLQVIRNGEFASEWETEQLAGYPKFRRLKANALAHPINQVEDLIHRLAEK